MPDYTSTALQTGQTLLFVGDSITDCGRREGQHAPLGSGYVRLFNDLLTIRESAKRIEVLNRGIGGNTIENLRSRWHDDVLTHRPQWLSVKIGINDLNRYLADGTTTLSPSGFEATYDQLLTLTHTRLPDTRLLLIAPFFLSTDTEVEGSYRCRVLDILPEYISVVQRLAEKHNALFLDIHARFQELLRHHHPDRFCPEPVHPYAVGHLVIAEAVYETLQI